MAAMVAGVIIAGLAGLVTSRGARAAGEDSETLIKKGVDLRRAGDDAGALRIFQEAYSIDHSPRALAQVGLAEQALGRWSSAEKHVNEALVLFGADPWIQKNAKVLETALAFIRDHLGSVLVSVLTEDGARLEADLMVDGQLVDRVLWVGQALRLPVGSARLRVEAARHRAQTLTVAVTHDRVSKINVTLAPEGVATRPPALDPAQPATSGGGAATESVTASEQVAGAEPDRPPRGHHRVAGAIVGGIGLAALGAGAVFAQRVKAGSDEVTRADTFPQGTQDAALRAQTLELAFLAAGTVVLAAGAVLFFWPSGGGADSPGRPRAALAPALGPGFAGGAFTLSLD